LHRSSEQIKDAFGKAPLPGGAFVKAPLRSGAFAKEPFLNGAFGSESGAFKIMVALSHSWWRFSLRSKSRTRT
jgi:hypothetical protein